MAQIKAKNDKSLDLGGSNLGFYFKKLAWSSLRPLSLIVLIIPPNNHGVKLQIISKLQYERK